MDAAAPLPPHVLGWLASQGIEVRSTTFPRRGNLNGTDCAAGICRELEAACQRHRSSHAIKLDDDTVIVRPEVFGRHFAAGAVGLTWTAGRPGAYGLAYALSRHTAGLAARQLEVQPLDPNAPEDLTIWHAARIVGTVIELPFQPSAGPWSAYPCHADPVAAMERFDVLTVGNPPPGGWSDRPRETALLMRRLVEAAMVLQSPCKAGAPALQISQLSADF